MFSLTCSSKYFVISSLTHGLYRNVFLHFQTLGAFFSNLFSVIYILIPLWSENILYMSSVIWTLLWFVMCPACNLSWEIFHVYLKRICISPIYFLPLFPFSTMCIIRQKLLILSNHLYSYEAFGFLILLVTERDMLKFLTVVGRVLRKFPRFPSLWYMPDKMIASP